VLKVLAFGVEFFWGVVGFNFSFWVFVGYWRV
jgi:hypothetical protein